MLKEKDTIEYKNMKIQKNLAKIRKSQREQLIYRNGRILKNLKENLNTENIYRLTLVIF